MNTKKHIVLFTLLGILLSFNSLAQSKDNQKPLTLVNYPDNIDQPLTKKELAQIKEVYGDAAESEILNRPQRVKDIKFILRARVEIYNAGQKDLSGLKKLSEVPLIDGYVTNLSRDVNFNPDKFNPLKYQFNFYGRDSYFYHVDNTSYYIIIKSQHQ